MTFRSGRSHITRQPYSDNLPYLPGSPFPASSSIQCLHRNMDGIVTQWAFYRVQEHPNRSSVEEVMTFRSWRSHMSRQPYPDSLPYLPECPFTASSSTHFPPKSAGKLTQWAFHRVQEHPNQSSDEEVMTFRSWRSCMILAGRNPSRVNPSRVNPFGVNPSRVNPSGAG